MILRLRRVWAQLLATMRPGRHEEEFREEMEAHLRMLVDAEMARGVREEAAWRSARMRMGGLAQMEERHRDWRGMPWLENLWRDARFAVRSFAASPRLFLTGTFTAAVAIGAATAVFSVVDHSLLRPFAYAAGDRLVGIGVRAPAISANDWLFAGTYLEWKRTLHSFDVTAAWRGVGDCDRNDGTPERLGCALVDRDFLPVLGVAPALGRNFAEGEDEPEAAPAVLLTHGYWVSRFGGDSGVLNKTMRIDGKPARIVGVLPSSFQSPSFVQADVLLPLQLHKQKQRQRLVQVIGRLREGVTEGAARAETQTLFRRFLETSPADFRRAVPMQLRLTTLREQQAEAYRTGLLLLLGAVLSFVLMACANVASLLLARSAARRHEFAVRATLGAAPGRLVQQTVVESAVLGFAGGGSGCGVAYGLLTVLQRVAPDAGFRITDSILDARVLAFALGLSLLTAVLFGLAPALERRRGESLAAPTVAGGRRQYLRSALVAAQFAISLILLTATGLFLTSLWRLQQSEIGFAPEQVVSASFILPEGKYEAEERQIAFFGQLEERLRSIPGVTAAAITDSLPPGGDPRSFPFVALTGGGDAEANGLQGIVKWRFVTTGYFETLRIPIRLGQGFQEEDRASGVQPIVISEGLQKRIFEKRDPMGATFRLWGNPCRVVGVAADVRNAGLRKAADPELYVLRRRSPTAISGNQRPPFGWRKATAVVRSGAERQAMEKAMAAAIHEVEPEVAVVTGTLDKELNGELAQPRFQTFLLVLFALIGLILAVTGLYGLTSFLVAARTREMGVRIALGATRADITGLVMGSGWRWTMAGMAAGTAGSIGLMRALRAVLFEAKPMEWYVLGAGIVLLAVAALVGMWVPSRRAFRIQPMVALRD